MISLLRPLVLAPLFWQLRHKGLKLNTRLALLAVTGFTGGYGMNKNWVPTDGLPALLKSVLAAISPAGIHGMIGVGEFNYAFLAFTTAYPLLLELFLCFYTMVYELHVAPILMSTVRTQNSRSGGLPYLEKAFMYDRFYYFG